MDGGAVPYGSTRGGTDLLDRPAAECLSHQEDFPGIAAGWAAEDGGVSAWSEASGEREANLVELWSLLPEHQKQELGALFSGMVMKLFHVLSNEEGGA